MVRKARVGQGGYGGQGMAMPNGMEGATGKGR